jgi:hypothetical protein
VHIICLTRAPSGIIAAFKKTDSGEQRPKTPLKALAYYLYVIVCLRIVRLIVKSKILAIQYENLINEPVDILYKIEKWCGCDLSEVREKVMQNELLNVGHIVTGNRVRKQGKIRFRQGTQNYEAQGTGERLIIWFMNFCRAALRF